LIARTGVSSLRTHAHTHTRTRTHAHTHTRTRQLGAEIEMLTEISSLDDISLRALRLFKMSPNNSFQSVERYEYNCSTRAD